MYPIAQHLAEKLHAYTLPRSEENTRVKDLMDLVFIASVEDVDAEQLLRALRATFAARTTHPLPTHLPAPPESWTGPFAAMAGDVPGAPSQNLADAYSFAATFWNPLLSRTVIGQHWSHLRRTRVSVSNRPGS